MELVNHILTRFLESLSDYEAARVFWARLLETVIQKTGAPNDWTPWELEYFLEGSPVPGDGNPILSARCETLGRAVRIIQNPPETDSLEIVAWVDSFDFSDVGGPPLLKSL